MREVVSCVALELLSVHMYFNEDCKCTVFVWPWPVRVLTSVHNLYSIDYT